AFLPLHEERYVFVAAPRLLREKPFRSPRDAKAHTLLDISSELPLYRYLEDASGGPDSLSFLRVVRLGSIAAIRLRVLQGKGVAVLPEYFVDRDLRSKRLTRLLPKAFLERDHFRLIFRRDDPRRAVFERLAASMVTVPLK